MAIASVIAEPIFVFAQCGQPADFSARLRRRAGVSIAARRAAELRRMVLQRAGAVCCALLALLAIQAWRGDGMGALALAATTTPADILEGQTELAPMPYEQPGESFPGSAYYYVSSEVEPAPQPRGLLSRLAGGLHWDGQAPAAGQADSFALPNSGPAARALTGLTATLDRTRALTCLTAAIYYEAASEPDDGQRAVAQVVLNRVAHPAYPKTVCGVVYQGSERTTGCQFTFTCDGALARKPIGYFWDRAENVARAALAGFVYAPVGLATHYHTFAVHPYWADSLAFIGQIGAHRFYRFNGGAGAPGTFRFAYAGGEPLPVAHLRSAQASAAPDAADPLAITRAYEAQYRSLAQQAPAATPAAAIQHTAAAFAAPQYTREALRRGGDEAYRARNLPGDNGSADTALPEYQNSGSWIASPQ